MKPSDKFTTKTKPIWVRISHDEHRRLKVYAAGSKQPMSIVAGVAIRKYIDSELISGTI